MAHWRWVAGRAVATAAAGPAGAVQVNVPFREPLLPDGPLAPDDRDPAGPRPFADVVTGRRTLDDRALDGLATRLAGVERGLIVAGPDDDPRLPRALAWLAGVTGFPIVADPLSGLRTGRHDRSIVITRADQLARPGPWIEAHAPDLVIRTGAMPTSKPVVELLARARPELLVLDGDGGWREAALIPATHRPRGPNRHGSAPCGPDVGPGANLPGRPHWLAAERAARDAMDAWLAALDEPFEGEPYPALAEALPDGAILWAGNSMPVRDLDAWLPSTDRALVVRSNRGANGIDGVVSTTLGSAAVADGPVALVVGDVSFLHDLNALVAARLHDLSATIVLVNNDGGGIFSFLPHAQPGAAIAGTGLPEHYEELFGTPHGVDVGPIVAALGGEHRTVAHGELAAAVVDSAGRPGVRVLELRTDRARNLVLHRAVAAAVQAALGGLRPT